MRQKFRVSRRFLRGTRTSETISVDPHGLPGARSVAMITERRFDELVHEHARAVTAYARAVAPDRWTAEDAVQETFLRAWKYLDSYRADGGFDGWLIRICRNCLIDLAARESCEPCDDLPHIAEQPDTSHEIFDLLGRLPIAQREVVALCSLLGYDYRAAGELLQIPIGTVRSRLHRARAAIATWIEHPDAEVSA
jgi:RNA polymerase sigma factor (sigma-70 family)